MKAFEWYASLIRPTWAPPAWVFGPVWTVLYAGISVSFGAVFYRVATGRMPAAVAVPFALNLIFNLAFSPIQFGLRSNLLAAFDILLVLGTLAWAIAAVYLHARWIAYAQGPYFLWVLSATVLQLTITWQNR